MQAYILHNKTNLTAVICLREAGSVSSQVQVFKRAKIGLQVKFTETLECTLVNPECIKRQISEHSDLSKSQVLKILSELDAYVYRQTSQQVLLNGDVECAMHGAILS